MKGVIIAHGELSDKGIIMKECGDSDLILCADGGAEYAFQNGILPDFLIGDFDSIKEEVLEYYKDSTVQIIQYPCDKDFTDTELCINKAIELGCNVICLLAGIGSRLDHSLGNISLIHKILDDGHYGYIAGEDCYIYVCRDELEVFGNVGNTISLIPLTKMVTGVNLSGLKFPLAEATISLGQSIGLSNEFIEDKCTISLKSGELLIIKNNNL